MNPQRKLKSAVDALVDGRVGEAETLYRQVLGKKPQNWLALHHLGVILCERGEYASAEESLQKSLAINGENGAAYSTLGVALMKQKKLDAALVAHRHAIRLEPNNSEFYVNCASTLLEQQKTKEAAHVCRKAIELNPDSFAAHYNLGGIFQRDRKLDEAVAAYRRAIAINPDFAEAYSNLALALTSLGKLEEALVAYRRSIELNPNLAETFNNLGMCLDRLLRPDEAAVAFRQAIAIRPTLGEAARNLATLLGKQEKFEEAVLAGRHALAVDPNDAAAEVDLIARLRHLCDWTNFATDTQRLFALADHVEPFVFLNVQSTAAEQLTCARRWIAKTPRGVPFVHDRARPSGRIRIGYLSADFRAHATAFLMAELFELHDRSRFETFAYSYGYNDNSDVRQRLVNAFDHFVELHLTPPPEAARRIYDDQIDILIDLKGYTGQALPDILVDRPAPIQVNYVGYPGTMGADVIDYIIGDPFVTPLEHQPFYAEKIVQLPNSYQPNDTKRVIATQTLARRDYGLPEQGFVFCAFNSAHKFTPAIFDVWMRLLAAVPGSVLWALSRSSVAEQNLRREAAARGVAPERLIFAPREPLAMHLARHRLADLFLDTLPYNAHTTASDALWAGLPVLTCAGETFAGRVAGSLLRAVGLPELVTASLADYENLALALAREPQKLAELKEKLARNLPSAPLFDTARYTRDLEAAYVRMWDLWRAGEAPQAIVLNGM
jgi:protein O-GlcNAc transferase